MPMFERGRRNPRYGGGRSRRGGRAQQDLDTNVSEGVHVSQSISEPLGVVTSSDRTTADRSLSNFADAVRDIALEHCSGCHRKWFNLNVRTWGTARTRMIAGLTVEEAATCNLCRNNPQFSLRNRTIPDLEVPPCLQQLTMVEEMLISIILPQICVVRLRGGQLGYKSHCISFSQDLQTFASELPRRPAEIDLLVVVKPGSSAYHREFIVSRSHVFEALTWLTSHNPWYRHIRIRRDIDLPEGEVPESLLCIHTDDDTPDDANEEATSDTYQADEPIMEHTGIVADMGMEQGEAQALRCFISEIHDEHGHLLGDRLNWPPTDQRPISEFMEDGLLSKCFPRLFPTGRGDPSSAEYGSIVTVKMGIAIKYLMQFYDGRFAADPRFRYFCYNLMSRHRALATTKVFARQETSDQVVTVDDLIQLVEGETSQLIRRLQRFVGHVAGSSAWKRARRSELLSMFDAVGCMPHLFFTFSSADIYWHDLQKLLIRAEGGDADTPLDILADAKDS